MKYWIAFIGVALFVAMMAFYELGFAIGARQASELAQGGGGAP